MYSRNTTHTAAADLSPNFVLSGPSFNVRPNTCLRWASLDCHRWAPLGFRGGMSCFAGVAPFTAPSAGGDVVKLSSSSFSSSSSSSPFHHHHHLLHHHHHLHILSSLISVKLPSQKNCLSVGLIL